MRWKKALGRNIVNTSTAESAGKVEGFVIDPSTHTIVSIISGDGIVDWSDTGGIGPDAVTSNSEIGAREPESEFEKRASDGAGDPIGKTVLTEYGFELGSVSDIDFDPESGVVNRLILADDDLKGSRLLGIGSHAVMVSSDVAASSTGDLDSLTKGELYERAKTEDVDGRSTMTKQELIAALS